MGQLDSCSGYMDQDLLHLSEFEFSSSDSDYEDHSIPTEACDNVAVKKAVSSILQL